MHDEDVEAYRKNGFLRLGRVIGEEDLLRLRAEEERFRPSRGYGRSENQTLRVAVQLCHRSEPVRELATRGAYIRAVVELIGPDVCLTHVQFVTKLPDDARTTSDIPWHQDSGYGELDPPEDLTVFIALTDMDEREGCLSVVPGSHRAGLYEHARAEANPVLREVRPEGERVSVPLAAGEALAFSGLLVHGSGPNRGSEPRIAFYTRYCVPWVRMMSDGGRPVLDDPHAWMVAGEARPPDPRGGDGRG